MDENKNLENSTPPSVLDYTKKFEGKEGELICWLCTDKADPKPNRTVHRTHEDRNKIFFYCTNCKNYFSFDGETYKPLGCLVEKGESVKPYEYFKN